MEAEVEVERYARSEKGDKAVDDALATARTAEVIRAGIAGEPRLPIGAYELRRAMAVGWPELADWEAAAAALSPEVGADPGTPVVRPRRVTTVGGFASTNLSIAQAGRLPTGNTIAGRLAARVVAGHEATVAAAASSSRPTGDRSGTTAPGAPSGESFLARLFRALFSFFGLR